MSDTVSEGTEHLYVLLRRAAQELERLEARGLARARARLRPAHVPVLTALLEASPLTPGELCARCEIEPSTMTGLLRSLEEQGLVVRERVVLDQRTLAISLSARGRAAARVAIRTRAWAEKIVLESLPSDSARVVQRLLQELSGAAQTAAALAESNPPRRFASRRR